MNAVANLISSKAIGADAIPKGAKSGPADRAAGKQPVADVPEGDDVAIATALLANARHSPRSFGLLRGDDDYQEWLGRWVRSRIDMYRHARETHPHEAALALTNQITATTVGVYVLQGREGIDPSRTNLADAPKLPFVNGDRVGKASGRLVFVRDADTGEKFYYVTTNRHVVKGALAVGLFNDRLAVSTNEVYFPEESPSCEDCVHPSVSDLAIVGPLDPAKIPQDVAAAAANVSDYGQWDAQREGVIVSALDGIHGIVKVTDLAPARPWPGIPTPTYIPTFDVDAKYKLPDGTPALGGYSGGDVWATGFSGRSLGTFWGGISEGSGPGLPKVGKRRLQLGFVPGDIRDGIVQRLHSKAMAARKRPRSTPASDP